MNPLYLAAIVVEVIVSALLIFFILLHAPKGEGLGGIGGTATLFQGKRGAEAGLDRITWILALVFLSICVLLGFGFIRP
jgi:preprotein translocase subunit SecG